MLKNAWEHIEKWLLKQTPEAESWLNPPATPEEIQEAETTLGITFPEDVKASYLRHNGQSQDAPYLLYGWEWLSLERICSEWSIWKELLDAGTFAGSENNGADQRVLKDWWHSAWIPLTYSGSGDHHCLDLAPGPQGLAGQIIQMWHDEGSRPVMATNFSVWISGFAHALQNGEFVYSEDNFAVLHKDDV